MTTLSRPRRVFWADLRFLVGVLLVAVSVGGVWLVVSSARDTLPVLQAHRTIPAGEALASADFRVVEVNLGSVAADYLSPHDLTAGLIAARTVTAGELLPRSAAAASAEAHTTSLVIESTAAVSARVGAGTVVELWQAPPLAEGQGFERPRILVGDVVVAAVHEGEGLLSQRNTALEIVVERSDVAVVLAAITDGSALSVVPVGTGTEATSHPEDGS